MERRKFVIGLGSAAIGGSALLGSGAFSRIESHRSVSIAVAEDPDAYLAMDKCPGSANSSYAHLDGHGHLELLMNEDNPTIGETPLGSGVNSNSRTWFDRVFQLCNHGKESVCIWIEDTEDWPTVPEDEGYPDAGERRVDFYVEDNDEMSIIGEENAIALQVGDCLCIGLRTRTHGLSANDNVLDELADQIVIVADVDATCLANGNDCVDCHPEDEFAGRLDQVTFENVGSQTKSIQVTQPGPGADPILYDDDVGPGDQFTVSVILQRPPNLQFFVDGTDPIEVVQDGTTSDEFHISCSKSVYKGQRLHSDQSETGYNLEVVGGVTRGGFDIC